MRSIKEDPLPGPYLVASWIHYPHNALGAFVRDAIRQIEGIRVRGELEGVSSAVRREIVHGYGIPDLRDRRKCHMVECGTTDVHKLLWCIDRERIFWWAGTLQRYTLWKKAEECGEEPPARGRFVLVRFDCNKLTSMRLEGGFTLTLPPAPGGSFNG